MDVLELLPRVVGAFYLLAGLAGLHAMALDGLMDKALAALTLKPVPARETVRRWLLASGSFTVGISGAALMVLSLWAVPLFLVAAALQLAWLVWARTNYEPETALEARGRRQTTNAAILYGIMTALVLWLGAAGRLHAWTDPWALFIPLAAAALLAVAGRHLLWRPARRVDLEGDEPDERVIRPLHRVRLEPNWGGYPLRDADTGEAVNYDDYVPRELGDRIYAWSLAFHAGDDAETRPFWVQFASREEEAAHRAEGEAIVRDLVAIFGTGNAEGPVYPDDIRYGASEP